jgi:hypothetical protein
MQVAGAVTAGFGRCSVRRWTRVHVRPVPCPFIALLLGSTPGFLPIKAPASGRLVQKIAKFIFHPSLSRAVSVGMMPVPEDPRTRTPIKSSQM